MKAWIKMNNIVVENNIDCQFLEGKLCNHKKVIDKDGHYRVCLINNGVMKNCLFKKPVVSIDNNGQRYWGKGWSEEWKKHNGEKTYLVIRARYYDKDKKKDVTKSFSVIKHGYGLAVSLAEQWRKMKLTGVL